MQTIRTILAGCCVLLAAGVMAQATLSGTVRDGAGNALAGANIWLSESRRGTASDELGAYRLEGIPAGVYTLQVSYLGYATLQKTLEIKPGVASMSQDLILEEHSYRVDELVVRATRSERLTPMTFLNLNEKELAPHNLGQDMPFLLQWAPSVVVTSDAGTGIGYTGIRIRGSDPTRINITINGIPLNDAESQQVYWVNMPDFGSSVADVQIQRGVGTSTNGAGAFGATINLNTSKVRHDPYGEVNLSAGSFNTWKQNVEFGSGMLGKHFTLDGRLSRISSDGYIDRASAALNSYYLSGAYVGDRSLLRFITFSGHERTYQAWYGVPADLVNDWSTRTFNPAGTERPGDPYENEVDDYGQTHYQLLFNQQLAPALNLNTALHYTKGGGFYEQYKAGETFEDYGLTPLFSGGQPLRTDLVRRLWLDNDFYGGLFSLQYERNGIDINAGGAFHRYQGLHFGELVWMQYASDSQPGDRYYENDGMKSDANVYAKALFPLAPRLHAYADMQFRWVGYEFLGYDNDGRNVTQDAQLRFFNPKFGFTYAPDARKTAYASFAVANREPNRDDYVQSTPDSRPRPERLYDTEIGYRFSGTKAGWEANAYYMYYQDQLVLNGQINDVGAYTRVNVPESYRLGLELAGAWQPGSWWKIQGNLALSANKVLEFEEFLDDYITDVQTGEAAWAGQTPVRYSRSDLAFSPALVGGLELSLEPFKNSSWLPQEHQLELAWMSRWVGRQYIDNSSDRANSIDPYTFTNLRLRYAHQGKLLRNWEFSVLVQNLFNAMYVTNAWSYRYRFDGQAALDQGFFPQAGRNVLLGLGVRF